MSSRTLEMKSPIGPLRLTSNGEALTSIEMLDHPSSAPNQSAAGDAVLEAGRRQLRDYFDGQLRAFELPLAPTGTPFQLRVWEQLRAIPFGTTISYGELAMRIGQPTASRAVGLANGRNPIAIVVPCHRVIGADGSLTGYGGGLDRKRFLLDLESRGSASAARPRTRAESSTLALPWSS